VSAAPLPGAGDFRAVSSSIDKSREIINSSPSCSTFAMASSSPSDDPHSSTPVIQSGDKGWLLSPVNSDEDQGRSRQSIAAEMPLVGAFAVGGALGGVEGQQTVGWAAI